jgi:hypothetical protein
MPRVVGRPGFSWRTHEEPPLWTPLGRVTYVTEGELRAIHRKVSNDAGPYEQLTPYHSFKQADGEPVVQR